MDASSINVPAAHVTVDDDTLMVKAGQTHVT